jgi:hypothetical protein
MIDLPRCALRRVAEFAPTIVKNRQASAKSPDEFADRLNQK